MIEYILPLPHQVGMDDRDRGSHLYQGDFLFVLKIHNHTQYVDKCTCCQDKNIDDIDIDSNMDHTTVYNDSVMFK
jgi:hypothetical protein